MKRAVASLADRCDVLHLTWSGRIGGIERQLAAIVRNANSEHLLTQRICFLDGRGSIGDGLAAEGLAYQLRFQRGWSPLGLVRLAWILRRLRPRIVHIHTHALLAQLTLLLALPKAIRVYTEHSPRSLAFDAKFRVLYWFLQRSCSRFIALHPTMARCIETYGINPVRLTAIPNGMTVSSRAQHPTSERSISIIGVVARLERAKRIDLYLDIIAELRRRGVACQGLVVGDGSQGSELVRYAKARGLEQHVRFVGEQEDVSSWLDQLDVFLMTSSVETFGLAALEAMARGVPVVAMPCEGGLADLVKCGGLLLADRNISTAADAIANLLASTTDRERVSARGHVFAGGHKLEDTVKKLKKLYRELDVGCR